MSTLFSPIREFFRKGDVLLLGLCLLASGYGLALIYSATHWQGPFRYVAVQSAAILLGVAAYVVLTFVDFQLFMEKCWKQIFVFDVLFILSVLSPFGTDHQSGNLNWLDIPGLPVDIQPNEIVKLAFILLLSLQITRIQEQERDISSLPSLFQLGGHAAFMILLIAGVCGDMGMCVVYLLIFACMAWVAGVKLRWFILFGGGGLLAAVILWIFVLPETSLWDSYLLARFRVLFDHDLDPSGIGYQQTRSLLAIGSGRLTGQGYLHGIQTQANYNSALPARHTDFIFSVCGEELGLIGCACLLGILTLIILRCLWIGRHASSPFYAYASMGVASMLIIQILLNVGMCLYIAPVMGLTLPFFSYGGTSMITLYAAMGIVSSAKARTLPSWLKDRSRI